MEWIGDPSILNAGEATCRGGQRQGEGKRGGGGGDRGGGEGQDEKGKAAKRMRGSEAVGRGSSSSAVVVNKTDKGGQVSIGARTHRERQREATVARLPLALTTHPPPRGGRTISLQHTSTKKKKEEEKVHPPSCLPPFALLPKERKKPWRGVRMCSRCAFEVQRRVDGLRCSRVDLSHSIDDVLGAHIRALTRNGLRLRTTRQRGVSQQKRRRWSSGGKSGGEEPLIRVVDKEACSEM